MIDTLPTNPRPVMFADSATLTGRHFLVESLLVVTVASKTLTLPTPTRDLAGKASYIINYSTGSLTISGAMTSGSSATMLTKTIVQCVCLPVAADTYKWHLVGLTSAVAGLQEIIEDYLDRVLQAGTNTGLTITYGDAGNTESIAINYAASATATATTSTSVTGSADTASRGDHQHGQGVHTHASATTGGTLPLTSIVASLSWAAWTATPVFTTATPSSTIVARYRRVANTVDFMLNIITADGINGVFTTCDLPVVPSDINAYIPLNAGLLVGATYTQPYVEIDCLNNIGGARIITSRATTVWTTGNACRLSLWGSYEVDA